MSRSRVARCRSIARMPRATAVRAARRARGPRRAPRGMRNDDRAARGLLRQGEQVRRLATAQGVPDRHGHPVLETHLGADRVDEVVDPRDALMVGAGQPGEPKRGPLDGDRRMAPGEVDDGLAGAAGQGAGAADDGGVEVEKGRLRGGTGPIYQARDCRSSGISPDHDEEPSACRPDHRRSLAWTAAAVVSPGSSSRPWPAGACPASSRRATMTTKSARKIRARRAANLHMPKGCVASSAGARVTRRTAPPCRRILGGPCGSADRSPPRRGAR